VQKIKVMLKKLTRK